MEICHELACIYNLTPQVVWETFTFQQIIEFYKILIEKQVENIKIQAKLHGCDIDDKNSSNSNSNSSNNYDFTSCKNEEEYKALVQRFRKGQKTWAK